MGTPQFTASQYKVQTTWYLGLASEVVMLLWVPNLWGLMLTAGSVCQTWIQSLHTQLVSRDLENWKLWGKNPHIWGQKICVQKQITEGHVKTKTKTRWRWCVYKPRESQFFRLPSEARREAWPRFSFRACRGNRLCWQPDAKLLASRTMKECISVVLDHAVCDTLLRQP